MQLNSHLSVKAQTTNHNGPCAVKRKYSTKTRWLVFLILISMIWGTAPQAHAQAVQSWSDPINLSMSGAATNPSLVVDSKGTLYAFWVDQFTGYQFTTSADGVTWSTPKAIKFPFSATGLPPRFIVDNTGRIHIFWINEKSALMYAQTTDAGIVSPPIWFAVKSLGAPIYDFDTVVDGGGRVHVGYIKNPKAPSAEPSGAYHILSPDRGVSWQPETLLYKSAYFRSVDATSAHIRLAASSDPENQNVYVVWDDRAQKRIFLGISRNGGQDWEEYKEILAPDSTLGLNNPFAADIELLQEKVLLTWQVGEPGVRCAVYSRASQDNGETWDEPVRALAEAGQCPEKGEFLSAGTHYSMMLLAFPGSIVTMVWNGSEWSTSETQTGPSSITNPVTFEKVELGCRGVTTYNKKLFVIGCDQAGGGDIWFTSRELASLETIFPTASAWGLEKNITIVPQKIESVSSVTDATGNAHVLWIETAPSETDLDEPKVIYTRWNGSEWSKPTPVITQSGGLPVHPTLAIDNQQRLFLSWVNKDTGDILFSSVNSEVAHIPREWMSPAILPSPSRLNDFPSMVVDAGGRIVVAYAVTINENRGIYLTQSTDQGVTWSAPQRAFDAVTAGWDRIGEPKLVFTDDGVLHLLFSQFPAGMDERSGILFYSQSVDGGASWSTPDSLTEHKVGWSYIAAIPQKGLHLLWQQNDNVTVSTYHKVSLDGGKTWDAPRVISNTDGLASTPVISIDWTGDIHFLQTSTDDLEYLNEWVWSGQRWDLVDTRRLSSSTGMNIIPVQAGVTSDGELYALLHLEYTNTENELQNELLSLNRSLEISTTPSPVTALITAPSDLAAATGPVPDVEITPTTTSPLAGLDDGEAAPNVRNVVGLFLVVLVVAVIIVSIVPKKKKQVDH
jgi:hypothetical protein